MFPFKFTTFLPSPILHRIFRGFGWGQRALCIWTMYAHVCVCMSVCVCKAFLCAPCPNEAKSIVETINNSYTYGNIYIVIYGIVLYTILWLVRPVRTVAEATFNNAYKWSNFLSLSNTGTEHIHGTNVGGRRKRNKAHKTKAEKLGPTIWQTGKSFTHFSRLFMAAKIET